MPSYQSCSPAEVQAYSTAYFAAIKLLADAQSEYSELAKNATDPADQAAYGQAAINAGTELRQLKIEYGAWLNAAGSVNPPLDSEVAEIVKTANDLNQAISSNAQASDILILVEHGMQIINGL